LKIRTKKNKTFIGIGAILICILIISVLFSRFNRGNTTAENRLGVINPDGSVTILEPAESPDKDENWISALERRAEEVILEMDGIEDVDVIISKYDAGAPTISVVIKTHTGENLSSDQVDALRKFLVSLISGANPEGITIATVDGQVL